MSAKEKIVEGHMLFDPPVYVQRYNAALDIMDDKRWCNKLEKVVEFGCSTMNFLNKLKNYNGVARILQVDCDSSMLRKSVYNARPMNGDYINPRKKPLNIKILHGSICDPDYRLIGCDLVVCIEVIEHLNPGTLDRFPHNIFGYIEPQLAIITTPNADFNVLFPRKGNTQFRHFDHRFEWTRKQFSNWASNIIKRYPNYTVEIQGVGKGPEGTEEYGHCSQLALFINQNYNKKADIEISEEMTAEYNENYISEEIDIITLKYSESIKFNDNLNVDYNIKKKELEENNTEIPLWDNINWSEDLGHYRLIEDIEYPFHIDTRTKEEKILNETENRIVDISYFNSEYYDEYDYDWKIPLKILLPLTEELKIELEEFRKLLSNNGYKIKNDILIHPEKTFGISEDSEEEEFYTEQSTHEEEHINNLTPPWDSFQDEPIWNV